MGCARRRFGVAAAALALSVVVAAQAPYPTSYVIDTLTGSGPAFDGVGAAFTGAAARMLYDYPPTQRTQILDYLFITPQQGVWAQFKGAALGIIKLEIGGDANTNFGSEPSYRHSALSDPDMTAGWSGWLAQQAFARNPQLKVMLTPIAFPNWLRFGNSDRKDPFQSPDDLAAYVAEYVQQFTTTYGVPVHSVGVWSSPAQSATSSTDQSNYIIVLMDTLQELGLGEVQIVCADQGDWSCVAAMEEPAAPGYSLALQSAIGIVGNRGFAPPSWANAVQTGKPLWVSSLSLPDDSTYGKTTSAGAMYLAAAITTSFVESDAAISGWIYDVGINAVPYGFPGWHTGLLVAGQPWSGSFYPTPALWAVAQINQFVLPGWVPMKIGGGSGALLHGGNYVTWVDEAGLASGQPSWALVITKFSLPDAALGVEAEVATFSLLNSALVPSTGVAYLVYSSFGYGQDSGINVTTFSMPGSAGTAVPISGKSFTVTLNATGMYTVYVSFTPCSDAGNNCPWKGQECSMTTCADRPPMPIAFPDTRVELLSCAMGTQQWGFVDVNGAFECEESFADGRTQLSQTSSGPPIGYYSDTRPHTLTGDVNTVDMDVAVDVYLPSIALDAGSYSPALLGARINPWNLTKKHGILMTPAKAMSYAPGVWLAVGPLIPRGTGLHWRLLSALDDASWNAPVAQGDSKAVLTLGAWGTLRLAVRGSRAIATWKESAVGAKGLRGGAALLFSLDISTNPDFPTAGFMGLGTGDFSEGVAFRNFFVGGTSNTCSAVPAAGPRLTIQLCQSGVAGLSFTFFPIDHVTGNNVYTCIKNFDAESEDSGPQMKGGIEDFMLGCNMNGTNCVGFNSNGWPKGRVRERERACREKRAPVACPSYHSPPLSRS
jgi:hypothetical protein